MRTKFAVIGRLAGTAVAAGLIVALVAMPMVGGGGYAVRQASDAFTTESLKLNEPPLPEKTRLLDSKGRQFAQFYLENRQSVNFDDIAQVMRDAIIAIEDSRFYEHGGLDARGTLRALLTNLQAGSVRQGGSSLTQQYVKNVLVERAMTEEERERARAPSLARKINELRYAVNVEDRYSKDEILERYLNISYYGAGAWGVEAAAKRFFGTRAKNLSLAQAATIAGTVRAPGTTDPTLGREHRARLKERRNLVLDRMAELRMISSRRAVKVKEEPLGLDLRPEPGGCQTSEFPYFCTYVKAELSRNPIIGRNALERARLLQNGGLTIKTTLDRKAQRAAEKAIRRRVDASDSQVAAQALVEPGTGQIKALAASKEFGTYKGKGKGRKRRKYTDFNLPADVAHGGGQGFQAGSTFKVFTLATALKKGWRFSKGFSVPGHYKPSHGYRDCDGFKVNAPGTTIRGGGGGYNLASGTWMSVNNFFMILERRVGLCDTVRTAKSLGIKRADGRPLEQTPTFTLGSNEMDPVTVAAAYAAFGARGKYCAPQPILEIRDRDGRRLATRPQCERAMKPHVADAVSAVLQGVFKHGTMRGQGIGRPAAGKTGTNNGYTSAWFAGYTPQLASAVSVGDIRGAYKHPLTGATIGGRSYGAVQGSSLPGPIWVDTMRSAHKGMKKADFRRPDTFRYGTIPAPKTPKKR